MKWINPATQKHCGQWMAHLVHGSPQSTRPTVLYGWAGDAGKRMWPGGCTESPEGCLKCQAAECNHWQPDSHAGKHAAHAEIEHRTAKCMETIMTVLVHQTVVCQDTPHGPPMSQVPKVCSRIESSDLEHMYKYFPNQEAWMWSR